ncbi:MAG: pyruvate formate lyase family protein, partial [Bacilli bacterium]
MSGDGHIIPNHEMLLEKGYGGLQKIARENLGKDGLTQEQKEFYEAAVISLGAAVKFIKRYSVLAAEMAQKETDEKR